MILATWILFCALQVINGKLLEIQDKNEFKKVLASHSNILISFLENDKVDASIISLLNEVADKGNKLAKVLTVNCQANKKLCKHCKANPKTHVIQHFHKGKFNKIYDRKLKVQSILRFLEDPTGDISWEEDDTAKDVYHIKGSQDFQKLVGKYKNNIPSMMLMFYAPWCGYCKQMKPEFSAAATIMKGKTLFIGINGDIPSTEDLKQAFNISGYPSVFLVQDGTKVYKYDDENSKDAIVKFVQNPTKPAPPKDVPWSEETSEIEFLTDSTFTDYIQQHESVLIMFYAPWCGHCKAMKPEFIEAASQLKKLKIEGHIAAIDSTENKNTSELYKIKGFPTVKYFKNGEFLYDVNERSSEGIIKFMKNPEKPVEKKAEIPWKEELSSVIHPTADEFRSVLKRFKHTLVMFYAPWCGHCKAAKPMFTLAANRMIGNSKGAFIAVDCTDQSYSSICSTEGVTGFPTLRYFNYGKNTSYSEYSLEREEDDFVAFMTNPSNPKLDARRHWRQIPGNEAVVVLETDNFAQNIVSQKSGALVMFYSPWCAHCVAMKLDFVNAAKQLKNLLPSSLLGVVDATSETKLAAQHKVTGFPTLIYFSPNADWVKYNGKRKEVEIVEFMIQKDAEFKREESEKIKREENKKVEEELKLKEVEKIKAEERKIKEEKEKKKTEEERKVKEEKEKKKTEEELKIKEEKEKKKIEEERKVKEEKEKKKAEEERKIKEEKEKKKAEEEHKIKEEKEKKKFEKERKVKEETEKKKTEEERKLKQENEKKKTEEKLKIKEDKEKKKIEEERKVKEEKEKKKIEEERKVKEEKEKKKIEEERKINEEKEKKKAEEEHKIKKENERKKTSTKKENYDESGIVTLKTLNNEESFKENINSALTSIFYIHKNNRKNNIRNKLLKLMNKLNTEKFIGFDVDCALLVTLCDNLNVSNTPVIFIYKNGNLIVTLPEGWNEDTFMQSIEHSTRVEL